MRTSAAPNRDAGSVPIKVVGLVAKILAGVAAGSARAQQPIPIVGFVHTGEAKPTSDFVAAFSRGLKDEGYVEGQTVPIEYRWADGHLERIPALVLELVRRPVAVLLTGGGDVPPLVAKGATATIPIVFVIGDDPVASGLVSSLNRPGSNVTGATIIASELGPKRVEMTLELLPNISAVAMLLNPNNPQSAIDSDITQEAPYRYPAPSFRPSRANVQSGFDQNI